MMLLHRTIDESLVETLLAAELAELADFRGNRESPPEPSRERVPGIMETSRFFSKEFLTAA